MNVGTKKGQMMVGTRGSDAWKVFLARRTFILCRGRDDSSPHSPVSRRSMPTHAGFWLFRKMPVFGFSFLPPRTQLGFTSRRDGPSACSSASSASALVGQTPPPAQQSCPHQSSRRRAAFAAVRPSAVLTTAAAQPLSAWPGPATRQAELHRVLSVASLLCRYHGAQS